MRQPVSYIACALLLLLALAPPAAWAPNYLAGDIAPRGNPDDQLNAGDLAVLQRIAIGQTSADAYEQLVGDVAPLGAPDGQINTADVLVLERAVLGLVTLPPISLNPPTTPTPDPLGSPTADNPVVVSGQADAGSTVQVYANAAVVASGTAGADGTFSVAAPLNEGVNVIQLSAIANGAESPLSSTQTVVLDSAAPVVNTNLVVTSLSGGRIRVTGSTEAGSAIQIDAADGQTVTGNADGSGNFAIVLNGQSGDGLSVRATDTAGNVSVSQNTTVVGATAGQFEVDDSGGANYTIPLQVPPGTAGMQPDLSLTFNSRTGNGLLGVGWSLGGLSTITRCPQTLAEDNAVGTVQFDSDDRFCLDGQRLIAIIGTYGDNGTEYRTARESFTRVISYGTAGSGPAWFKVWTKSGQILRYGYTADARIEATGRSDVMVWAVDRIEDRVENYLTVEYNEDIPNGVYEPTAIRYTANDAAGLTASQSVIFSYQPSFDAVKYLAGSRMQRLRQLAAIQTYDGATLVKQYTLAYSLGFISKRSRLTSVTECDAANRCYPPTVFNWQMGSLNTFSDGNTWATGKYANFNSTITGAIRIGDPTGDGRSDVLLGPDIDSNEQWHMLRSTGSSFDDAAPGGLWADTPPVTMNCAHDPNHIHAIDGTGNGLTDIIAAPTDLGGTVLQLTSTATASWPYNLGQFTALSGAANCSGGDTYFELDVDGDGRVDLVRNTLLVLRNTSLGGIEIPSWPVSGLPSGWDPDLAAALDMNADGRGDLLFGPDGSGNWTVVKSTGSSFVGTPWGGDAQYANWQYSRRPLDVNGDGLPDMVLGPNPAGNWYVLLNTGTGFIDAGKWIGAQFGSWATDADALLQIRPMDTNGDGLQDLLLGPDSNGNWFALESTGASFLPKAKLSGAYASWASGANAKQIRPADLNGNGKTDLLLGPDSSGNWYAVLQSGAAVDQLVSINSGQMNTDITYARRRLGNLPIGFGEFPTKPLTAPLDVVATVVTTDGVGGTYTQTYDYADAKIGVHGRGFLGFSSMTRTDSRNTIATTTQYAQAYPYTGMVTAITQTDTQTNRLLHTTTSSLAALELDGAGSRLCTTACQTDNLNGRRHFPYAASAVGTAYNLASGALETSVQTSTTYDNNGNVQQLTVTTKGPMQGNAWVKTTVNTYIATTANWLWLLGRLTRAEVTHSGPGQTPITRVSAFVYDTRGLLIQEIIEPDEPDTSVLKQATEYKYDSFGNNTKVSVIALVYDASISGSWQQKRNTETQYDTKGRFPVSTTNALKQTETYVYDGRFGVRTQLTGPNGLVTNWTYDTFGRLTKETRVDNTVTDVSYRWCGTDCPNGGYAVHTRADGNAPVTRYKDILNRDILTQTQGLDGRIINQRTVYDALGRPLQLSEPYFAGDTPAWLITSYDLLDRPKIITKPGGEVRRFSYSINGDFLSTTENPDGVSGASTERRNAIGQTVSIYDRLSRRITYAYNAVGNLKTTTDSAGNIVQLTYDIRGRKISLNDPDMGNWIYAYNGYGDLISQTDAKGQTITMGYDTLGRMFRRNEPEGTSTWVYDTAANGTGKLARETGPGGYVRIHTYDSRGRPAQTATTIVAQVPAYTLSTAYDDFSRVSQTTYPTGFAVNNVYSARGDLLEVRDAANDTVFWSADSQNARGQATLFRLGSGLTTVKSFDAEGLPTLITTGFGSGSAVQNQSFGYDVHGNLKTRTDFNQTPPSGTGNLVETFTYDTLFRLKTATLTGIGVRSYSYDALGNITSKTGVGSYTYGENGAGPHAVTTAGSTTYTYDANGNQTGGDGRTIAYTSFNKASSISKGGQTTTFDYGVDRFRTRQISPDATTVYINPRLDKGAHYEQETRNGQIEDKHYIYGGTGIVAVHTQKHPDSQPTNITASTRYLHTDHLGSIVAITNEQGLSVEAFGYSPFGARRNAAGTDPTGILTSAITHQGYTGHEMLDDLGLIHANARLYDPKLGRFLNADPIIQFPGNLQSYNRYTYTFNNPLSFTDPSGLFVHKKIKKGLKKLFKNKIFRIVAAIAVSYATFNLTSAFMRGLFIPGGQITGAAAAGAAAGFAGGLVITNGDVNASLKLAAAGALTAGTLRGFSGSGFAARLAGNSIAGGASSKFLGGSFQRGAVLAALTVSASELVTRVTKTRPTFKTAKGEAVGKPIDGLLDCSKINCDVVDPRTPNVGNAFFVRSKDFVNVAVSRIPREALVNPPGFFNGESGILSFFAKTVPGLNSGSVFHDSSFGQLARNISPIFNNKAVLATTIPPFFAVQGVALGVPQLVDGVRNVEDQ